MSVTEMLAGGGITLAVLLTLVQISPIKFDPWTLIGKLLKKCLMLIGRLFNGEVLDKVTSLEKKVSAMEEADAKMQEKVNEVSEAINEQSAINARSRILRFGDEILHNARHSKDHFDSTLRDIRMYETYCKAHPDFENGVTEATVERIKEVYQERLEKNDFL